METAGVSFPVVLFDGEREIKVGDVVVHPFMDFKNFRSILTDMIGIAPNQISVYLADRKNPRFSQEDRRKIPITSKSDFSAIIRQNDCFFLVVLKRSRREKRRNSPKDFQGNEYYSSAQSNLQKLNQPLENVVLLRRNSGVMNQEPFWMEYERRVRDFQIERNRYLMNMNTGFDGLRLDDHERSVKVVCEECLRNKRMGREDGFHCCVYDPVTVGFRSSAGPIARPVRGTCSIRTGPIVRPVIGPDSNESD